MQATPRLIGALEKDLKGRQREGMVEYVGSDTPFSGAIC